MIRPGPAAVAAGIALAVLTAACGSAPSPTPSPVPTPTPTATPLTRLAVPYRAGGIIVALREAGLTVIGNTARAGLPGEEPRTTMFATYGSWPLTVIEYSSSATLRKGSGFVPNDRILPGDPPYVFVAANVLVEYGPRRDGRKPARPTADQRAAALTLVQALDPRVGPLVQRSITPAPLPTPVLTPSPIATPTAPLAASPGASPGGTVPPPASSRRTPLPLASP